MILYQKIESKLAIERDFDIRSNEIPASSWLDVVNPSSEDLELIVKRTGIPLDFLLPSLDPAESARVDLEDDNTLIVLDVPIELITEEDKKSKKKVDYKVSYETIPLVVVSNSNYIVTISKVDTGLPGFVANKTKIVEPNKHVRLSLQILFRLAQQFITFLKRMDYESKVIEKKLRSSLKNKEIFELMSLNEMLVYFSTALNGNKNVLEKLKRLPQYKQYEDDYDLIEDVQVEFNQAIEMCSVFRDILSGMMDAFASIISNNLNIVMKTLSIITIVISIPTLIASLFGMNFAAMPFYNSENAFWIVVAVSAGIATIGAIALGFLDKFRRK